MIETLSTTIWGREFAIPVIYDCYSDKVITDGQMKAVEIFAKHSDWVEKAKSKVQDYCKSEVMDDAANTKKDNIFSYIKPERLYVKHEKENPRVAIMCKYRYDPEHGLAVVFSHDGKIVIGSQDIIL